MLNFPTPSLGWRRTLFVVLFVVGMILSSVLLASGVGAPAALPLLWLTLSL